MDIEKAMLDPVSVFVSPGDVFGEQSLTRELKIKILSRWEYDARELEVAEEENMGGGPADILDEINTPPPPISQTQRQCPGLFGLTQNEIGLGGFDDRQAEKHRGQKMSVGPESRPMALRR